MPALSPVTAGERLVDLFPSERQVAHITGVALELLDQKGADRPDDVEVGTALDGEHLERRLGDVGGGLHPPGVGEVALLGPAVGTAVALEVEGLRLQSSHEMDR